jgi:hypothetical protein
MEHMVKTVDLMLFTDLSQIILWLAVVSAHGADLNVGDGVL